MNMNMNIFLRKQQLTARERQKEDSWIWRETGWSVCLYKQNSVKDVIDADHDKWSSSIIIIFGIRIDIAYSKSQY